MIHVHFAACFEIVAVLGTVASLAYYVLCLSERAGFLRDEEARAGAPAPHQPFLRFQFSSLSKGTDPEMYESFRSHCLQDYPEYEIIFGVSDAADPAIALVERLKAEFPQRCDPAGASASRNLGANIKVSNLAQMLAEARYEHIVVNDSDIRVEPDYLRQVVAPSAGCENRLGDLPLSRRGRRRRLGSRLESLGISTDFARACWWRGCWKAAFSFGLGSTLAFRRQRSRCHWRIRSVWRITSLTTTKSADGSPAWA